MSQELFLDAARKALAQDLSVIDLFGTAEKLKASGHNSLALQLYELWVGRTQQIR